MGYLVTFVFVFAFVFVAAFSSTINAHPNNIGGNNNNIMRAGVSGDQTGSIHVLLSGGENEKEERDMDMNMNMNMKKAQQHSQQQQQQHLQQQRKQQQQPSPRKPINPDISSHVIQERMRQLRDVQPKALDIASLQGKTAMFISAHPDDIEVMAGGLVAKLVAQNTRVVYVIVTNGDKGCVTSQMYNCSAMTSVDIAEVREKEARTAAMVLGVTQVVMLDLEDGFVVSYPEMTVVEKLTAVVRRYRPSLVVTWHPDPQYSLQPGQGWFDLGYHPDHQAVGRIALETTFGPAASDPYMFPELLLAGLAPYGVSIILTMDCLTFDHYLDITAQMPLKISAMLAHHTQFPDEQQARGQAESLGATLAAMLPSTITPAITYAETYYQICMNTNCAVF